MKKLKIMSSLLIILIFIFTSFPIATMAAGQDLLISSVKASLSTVYDGDYVTLNAMVRNNCDTDITGKFSVSFYVNGKLFDNIYCAKTIEADDFITISSTRYYKTFFGSHKLRACINESDEVIEANYANNNVTQRFSVIDEDNPNPKPTPSFEDDQERYAGNPIISSIFTADPSAHVWKSNQNKIYIYASHDVDPARGCDLMDRYHVFSSEDMVTWIDEGEILSSEDNDWGRSDGGFMWAPDAAYKNGTYYFYYPHPTGNGSQWNSTWKIGVATSKEPAAGFKDQGYITDLAGYSLIDPCVFQDDDGQDYIYIGGGNTALGGKLGKDMMSIDGGMQPMTGLPSTGDESFHEGTWVFKRNGIYYFMYADNKPYENRLQYATSTSPLGPWTYRGMILDSTNCDTSHGSITEFKGQWYLFYHDSSLSNIGQLRTVCVDKVEFNADGTIKPVVATKEGVKSVAKSPFLSPNIKTYNENNCTVGGGATMGNDAAAKDGQSIGNLHIVDSYVEYANIDGGLHGGQYTINLYFAAESTSKIRMFVNGKDYSLINTLGTGGWSTYTGKSYLTVRLSPGKTNTIKFVGGNGGVNVDYITAEQRF